MSRDFEYINNVPSLINNISDKISVPVDSGPAQNSYQQFIFNSTSNSALSINLPIPSESVAINPRVMISAKINITINCEGVPVGQPALSYGVLDAFNSYPISSTFLQASALINNANVSVDVQNTLPFLKLLEDFGPVDKMNSTSPNCINQNWGVLSNGALTNSSPFGNYNEANYDNSRIPNASVPIIQNVTHTTAGGVVDNSLISTSLNDTWSIEISTVNNIVEPLGLALSPFISRLNSADAAFLGINTIALTINLDSQLKKIWANGSGQLVYNQTGQPIGLSSYITSITPGTTESNNLLFTNAQLLLNYYSLTSSQYSKIPTKNITGYLDYGRQITSSSLQAPILPGQTGRVVFNNLQFNQVPLKLCFSARLPVANQSWQYSDTFLTIKNVSITFNNSQGIFSSATPYELYYHSVQAGSTQSWYSFSGQANAVENGVATTIPTLGSVFVIDPAYMNLNELISVGSLGQYNFQLNAEVYNQYPFAITPELILMIINMGSFTSQLGTSQLNSGLIDMQSAMEARQQPHHKNFDSNEFHTTVGGGLRRGIKEFTRYMRGKGMHHKDVDVDIDLDSETGGKHKKMSMSKLKKLLK
jgi:hypothetical protein